MSERPEFVGPADSEESVFSRGGQDASVPQDPPPPDEGDLPETVLASRQNPPAGPDGPDAPAAPGSQEAPAGADGPAAQGPPAAPAAPETPAGGARDVPDEPTARASRIMPPWTAQPFPNASNYRRDPAAREAPSFVDPGASGAPVAPPGNHWQPRQASSNRFQTGAPGWYGAPATNPPPPSAGRATGHAQGADPAAGGYAGWPQGGYAGQAPVPVVPSPAAPGPCYELGPILIRGDRVITPNGTIPLSQAQFSFQDMSQTVKSTPTWAIVLAIVLVWLLLLSLLLLIVQEERTTGQVVISVVGGEGAFTMTVPVTSRAQVGVWAQQVQYAQMIAARARG